MEKTKIEEAVERDVEWARKNGLMYLFICPFEPTQDGFGMIDRTDEYLKAIKKIGLKFYIDYIDGEKTIEVKI